MGHLLINLVLQNQDVLETLGTCCVFLGGLLFLIVREARK